MEPSKIEKAKVTIGRGAGGLSSIPITEGSTLIEDLEIEEKFYLWRYFKTKVIASQEASDINDMVQESIDEKTLDKKKNLRLLHLIISNAKLNFLGNYHKIKRNACNYT